MQPVANLYQTTSYTHPLLTHSQAHSITKMGMTHQHLSIINHHQLLAQQCNNNNNMLSSPSTPPSPASTLTQHVTIIYLLGTHTLFPRLSSTPLTEHQLIPSSLVTCPLITLFHQTPVCSHSFFCSSLKTRNTIMLYLRQYPWTHILPQPSLTFLDNTALSYLGILIIFSIT